MITSSASGPSSTSSPPIQEIRPLAAAPPGSPTLVVITRRRWVLNAVASSRVSGSAHCTSSITSSASLSMAAKVRSSIVAMVSGVEAQPNALLSGWNGLLRSGDEHCAVTPLRDDSNSATSADLPMPAAPDTRTGRPSSSARPIRSSSSLRPSSTRQG